MATGSWCKIPCVLMFSLQLCGCALSIQPVVPESDATFDPRLLGSWEEVKGGDRATLSRGSGNAYAITYTKDGKTGVFEARLGRVGTRTVLDVWPTPQRKDLPEPYTNVLIPGHVFLILDIGTDKVALQTLDPDSLLAALRSGSLRLPYRQTASDFVLHGTTEELRNALTPYLARTGVLSQPQLWQRVTESAAGAPQPVEIPCFESSAWREADRLFHRDPHWVGGDGASSVDLGGGRVLWLFGDSWIDPTGKGTRSGARLVSNSVAVQTGTDPGTASISFHWGKKKDGRPDAMFPDRDGESFWPGSGVRVGDRLVLFFARVVRNTGVGFGFESVGWKAVMVENPDAAPSSWRLRPLRTPTNTVGVLVGFAATLTIGDHIVALGPQNPVKSHPIYAVRWPLEKVRQGDLMSPEWWGGDLFGWVPDSSATPRWPLFENGQAELTVHIDGATQRFLQVQTVGFGPADIMMRAAPRLTGPWSAQRMVYRPPEYYRPGIMIYQGKAHPEQSGADLALTYSSIALDLTSHVTDTLLYYPRFVRLTRCR